MRPTTSDLQRGSKRSPRPSRTIYAICLLGNHLCVPPPFSSFSRVSDLWWDFIARYEDAAVPRSELNLYLCQYLDDIEPQLTRSILPINPHASSVQLTLCNTYEGQEQEQSRLLIADLMTNEAAAANIESFIIEYFCAAYDGEECECSDLLGPLVELIDRGGSHFKVLKQVKWVSFHDAYSRRF